MGRKVGGLRKFSKVYGGGTCIFIDLPSDLKKFLETFPTFNLVPPPPVINVKSLKEYLMNIQLRITLNHDVSIDN